MSTPEDQALNQPRGLAPSATPSVVYGVIAFALAGIPILGFLLGWMALFRSQQSAIQLQEDDRLEGRGLMMAGCVLGIAAMVLGAASTVVWLVILVRSLL